MTDSLLSNRFAHRFEPPAVLKAVNDRGALGPLDGRVFKLGPEWNPKAPEGDEPADSDVRIGNCCAESPGWTSRGRDHP